MNKESIMAILEFQNRVSGYTDSRFIQPHGSEILRHVSELYEMDELFREWLGIVGELADKERALHERANDHARGIIEEQSPRSYK